jgi:hypothetical protein
MFTNIVEEHVASNQGRIVCEHGKIDKDIGRRRAGVMSN